MLNTRSVRKQAPGSSPASRSPAGLALEGQSLSSVAESPTPSPLMGGARSARGMASGTTAGAMASGRFSPTRPLSPLQEGDSLAQEVESELKFQGDLAKKNRDRVEAMRTQLRKFQQLTASNAKEIKALRAERFKQLQAEDFGASLEESVMEQEDAARESFAKQSFVVPHADLPDVGAGAKGGVDPDAVESTAKSEERVKDELYPASDPDSDVESITGRMGMLELAALAAGEEAAFMKIKTYRNSIFGPKGEEHMQSARESHLQPVLEKVSGYSVRGRSNNALWLASHKAVYTSGSMAVIATPDALPATVTQEFFTMHAEEISAICVHPDGMTVATGEHATEPIIYVWDSSEIELLGPPLVGFHKRGIACLEFSKDGMLLFSVGKDAAHHIAVHDWKTGALVCFERGDSRRNILAMRCNPHDGLVVTVGSRHIKFWSLTVAMSTEPVQAAPPISVWQKQLEARRGVFGRHGVSKSHTLLCVEFGGPGVTIAGSRDGSLLVWKGVVLASWLQAHVGPVFSIWGIPAQGQTRLCTGGKDGNVGLWMFDASLHLDRSPVALPKHHRACIRSVCWHQIMDQNEILVATAAGKVLILSPELSAAGDEAKVVTRGHERGPIRALAGHPEGKMFVTGGANGQLLLWDVDSGTALTECTLPSNITYASYHKDGNKVAVCMESGGGFVVAQTPHPKLVTTSYRFCELVKSELAFAKYSPDSDMLVCGFRSKIEIYNADSLKSKIGSLVGHEGNVTNIDWSTDGRYLVSISDTYELKFWDRFTGRPILASGVANFADPRNEITWATWTGNLGWAVQGIVNSGEDEFSITSVFRDSTSSLLLTGDSHGAVSLWPYPCADNCFPVAPARLHVGPVAKAIFLEKAFDRAGAQEGGYVVSLGKVDLNVLIWRLERAAPRAEALADAADAAEIDDAFKRAPEIETIIQESRAKARSADDAVVEATVDEFEAVKPYLMSVCPPSAPLTPPEAFDWQLELQHVHGFQGVSGCASAFTAANGHVVYAAGACCIVQVPDTLPAVQSALSSAPAQRHFTQHTDLVHCMACHPAGLVIASCDGQADSSILVWSVDSCQVIARLPTGANAIALLRFSDDKLLIGVSNDPRHPVLVWDWHEQTLVAEEDGDYEAGNRILALAVDPFPTAARPASFMTCGLSPVKFWTFARREEGSRSGFRLTSCRGQVDDEDARHVMLCACAFLEEQFVSGSDKGQLFLWKSLKVHHRVSAHDGRPVFALSSNRRHQLCSGSDDACIKIWSVSLQLLHTVHLDEQFDNTFLDLTVRRQLRLSNPGIRTIDWNDARDKILIGTASGEVLDLCWRHDTVEAVEFHTHSHSSGKIRALCSHPAQEGPLLVASGGEDRSIRLWEVGRVHSLFCMIISSSVVTALEFSPDAGKLFGETSTLPVPDPALEHPYGARLALRCKGLASCHRAMYAFPAMPVMPMRATTCGCGMRLRLLQCGSGALLGAGDGVCMCSRGARRRGDPRPRRSCLFCRRK